MRQYTSFTAAIIDIVRQNRLRVTA